MCVTLKVPFATSRALVLTLPFPQAIGLINGGRKPPTHSWSRPVGNNRISAGNTFAAEVTPAEFTTPTRAIRRRFNCLFHCQFSQVCLENWTFELQDFLTFYGVSCWFNAAAYIPALCKILSGEAEYNLERKRCCYETRPPLRR